MAVQSVMSASGILLLVAVTEPSASVFVQLMVLTPEALVRSSTLPLPPPPHAPICERGTVLTPVTVPVLSLCDQLAAVTVWIVRFVALNMILKIYLLPVANSALPVPGVYVYVVVVLSALVMTNERSALPLMSCGMTNAVSVIR